ncbi:MAG: hypothetical protein WCQ95_01715 [Bacteroidota bacterium]
MRILYKILTTLVLLPTLCFVFIFGGISLVEGYNIFDPYIDTEFATGYTPKKFDSITTEFTKDDVIKCLGNPLFIFEDPITKETQYDYTNDGYLRRKSKRTYIINDFAWYCSRICFDQNGKIVKIYKDWCHD